MVLLEDPLDLMCRNPDSAIGDREQDLAALHPQTHSHVFAMPPVRHGVVKQVHQGLGDGIPVEGQMDGGAREIRLDLETQPFEEIPVGGEA